MGVTREQNIESRMQERYPALGSADTTPTEYRSIVEVDMFASLLGHRHILQGVSLGVGASMTETKNLLIDAMAVAATEGEANLNTR